MPHRCVVLNCRGNYDNGPRVSTFIFPKEAKLLKRWIHALNRKNFIPTKSSRVCELHFSPSDILRVSEMYDEKTGKTVSASLKSPRLVKGAIPQIDPNFPDYQPPYSSDTESSEDSELEQESQLRTQRKQGYTVKMTFESFNQLLKAFNMPCKCCVPGCKTNYNPGSGTTGKYTTVFGFPKNVELKKKWLSSMNREHYVPGKFSVVCIHHFPEEFLLRHDTVIKDNGKAVLVPKKRPKLISNAYPCIFPSPPAPVPIEPRETNQSPNKRLQESELKLDSDETKWDNTKGAFKQTKRKGINLNPSGAARERHINGTYHFVDGNIADVEATSCAPNVSVIKDTDDEWENVDIDIEDTSILDVEKTSVPKPPTKKARKAAKNQEKKLKDDIFKEILKGRQERIKFFQNFVENHPMDSFFKSMSLIVQTFPPSFMAEARTKVLNVITEIEAKAIASN